MKKMKMLTPRACLLWHRWVLKKDTGLTRYHECKDCGSRIVQQPPATVYQPIDYAWVTGINKNIKL